MIDKQHELFCKCGKNEWRITDSPYSNQVVLICSCGNKSTLKSAGDDMEHVLLDGGNCIWEFEMNLLESAASEEYYNAVAVFKALIKSGDGRTITWERVSSMTDKLTAEELERYKKETWEIVCDIRNHPQTEEIKSYLEGIGVDTSE